MNKQLCDLSHAPLTVTATILCFLATPSSVIGAESEGMLFDGGGSGPTIEIAIRRAIFDAEVSASAHQLYTCELVGEPQIFPGSNPESGRNFSAQVMVACTP